MGQMSTDDILRRLLRAAEAEPPKAELTASRALRVAAARAAEQTLGLALTVLGVAVEPDGLDGLERRLTGDWLLLGLWREGALVGVAGLDAEARAAAIEMQTLGLLRGKPAVERPISPSDVALSGPFVTGLLEQIEATAEGTELAGWALGAVVGPRMADARAVGLALEEMSYRCVEMTLDLATGEREGRVLIALPTAPVPVQDANAPPDADRFTHNFRATVMEAPATLHAVLHRMKMPLSKVAAFEVGQTVALPGITVGSVRMEGPGGQVLGRARLGQVTGLRAVRLEVPGLASMSEVRLPERSAVTAQPPQGGDLETQDGEDG